jgi:hypothetical protein
MAQIALQRCNLGSPNKLSAGASKQAEPALISATPVLSRTRLYAPGREPLMSRAGKWFNCEESANSFARTGSIVATSLAMMSLPAKAAAQRRNRYPASRRQNFYDLATSGRPRRLFLQKSRPTIWSLAFVRSLRQSRNHVRDWLAGFQLRIRRVLGLRRARLVSRRKSSTLAGSRIVCLGANSVRLRLGRCNSIASRNFLRV